MNYWVARGLAAPQRNDLANQVRAMTADVHAEVVDSALLRETADRTGAFAWPGLPITRSDSILSKLFLQITDS